ncbi:lipopolysaccharide biosynthesis protein [Thermodesulfobacteriota bacterium]
MISKFILDLVKYTPSKIFPAAFAVLIIPVITRLLSADLYGEYVIVTSTLAVLVIITTEWITMSIIRYYSSYERDSKLPDFYFTILSATFISLMLINILLLLNYSFNQILISSDIYDYFIYIIIILDIGIIYNIFMQFLVVQRKPSTYSFFYIYRQCVCILIGVFIAWTFKSEVRGLLQGTIIGHIIILPILFLIVMHRKKFGKFSTGLFKNCMKYGIPLVITNLAGWILTLSDRFIIKYFRGNLEVGIYSISYKVAEQTIYSIILLIGLASAPLIMDSWENKGAEETVKFIEKLTKIFLIVSIPAATGISLISKPLIEMLATPSYYSGYKIIPIVAFGVLIFGLQRNFQVALLIFKRTNYVMYLTLIAGIINIVLNVIFIPKYGYFAAAYTTLLSYLLFAILMIIISRKYLKWKFPMITLAKVIVSSFIMSLAVSMTLRLNIANVISKLSLSVVTGIIMYSTFIILLKEIDIKEMYIHYKKKVNKN